MSESRYDAVIIGSGLGGLVSAYILSKNGMKVAVFEKHSVPGGCLQSFSRGGVRFETGMHYIGSMGEGEALYRYFKYLGIVDNLPLSKMDEDAYELISFNGERYRYATGHERFIDTLSPQFPGNAGDIREYVSMCAHVTETSPMYSFGPHDNIALLNPDHVLKSVSEVIDGITANPRLRNVLTGISPLYGGVKDVTPLYIHALIWDFYNKGAYRIVGGSDRIAALLCDRIRSFGGEIFTGSEVLSIETRDYVAGAVDVKGMGRVECDWIISDIHPQLVLDLVEPHVFRKVYKDRIRSLRQTTSNFSVYIKFKPGRVPYLNSNFYHYRGDVWGCSDYTAEDWPKSFLYMHQCSGKDQRFATHAIIFAYMNWADVEQWADTTVGHRGEAYREFKERCREKLLARLESEFPGTLDAIEDSWTSTPLTYRDYTGTIEGSMYGIVHDKARLSQTTVSQRTKVRNLFLAGQNINSHGILGVTIGAILACSELLGFDYLVTQIKRQSE